MSASWLLYATALSLVLGAAALALEHALRLYRRATRWLWATSLLAALVLPLAAWLVAPRAPLGTPLVLRLQEATRALTIAGAAALPVAWRHLPRLPGWLDGALPWLGLAASVAVALAVAASYLRLRRQRARWAERELDGLPVLVSERVGPAVVGVRRSRIVVPSWVLDEPAPRRRMILAHEAEHLAAGDARLLAGALGALVAAPWNLGVWWQLRRLRLATEMDCDARVLRRGEDARAYAALLLEVGSHEVALDSATAFAEPRSALGRRLRVLVLPRPGRRARRALGATSLAAGLLALAWSAPRPSRPAGGPHPSVAAAPRGTALPRAGVRVHDGAPVASRSARAAEAHAPGAVDEPAALRVAPADLRMAALLPSTAEPAPALGTLPLAGGVQDTRPDELPPGWRRGNAGAQDYRFALDGEVRAEGGASGHLAARTTAPHGLASFAQRLRAERFRGERVRLSALVRMRGVQGRGWLQLRADAGGRALDEAASPVLAGDVDWSRREVIFDVPRDAEGLLLRVALAGAGELWVDDVALEVVGPQVLAMNTGHAAPEGAHRAPGRWGPAVQELQNPRFERD